MGKQITETEEFKGNHDRYDTNFKRAREAAHATRRIPTYNTSPKIGWRRYLLPNKRNMKYCMRIPVATPCVIVVIFEIPARTLLNKLWPDIVSVACLVWRRLCVGLPKGLCASLPLCPSSCLDSVTSFLSAARTKELTYATKVNGRGIRRLRDAALVNT